LPTNHPTRSEGAFARSKGCLGVVAGCVITVVASCSAAVFTARDVVSTYLAEPARAMGVGWLAEQPRPSPGTWGYAGNTCALTWKRVGFETAKYIVTCDAEVDLLLSEFEVVSTLDPTRVYPDEVFEYQGPMSGQEIRVESHRKWLYNGTIWLGSSLPFWGEVGPRHLVMTATVNYPDASVSERQRIAREAASASQLLLVASEPGFGRR
jgi:hypothetical protein